MQIQLRPLELSDAEKLYEFFQQMPALENGKHNSANGLSPAEFSEWVKKHIDYAGGKDLPEGYVPCTTYILYVDGVPVGYSNLRHHLNPKLEKDGGHIGTQVLPQYRGKGYGDILKRETLKKAKEMGIDSVLIFNHDDNVPAWRSSEKNGGKLASVDTVDGIRLRKYVFDMSKKSGR